MDEIHEMYAFYFGNVQCHILKFRRALMIIDELKQLTKVAEHEQYKTGALKRKRQVKQSGNILK
jgi:hypothetical protein